MWESNGHDELLVGRRSRKPLLPGWVKEERERRVTKTQRELELKLWRTPRQEMWPFVEKSSHCQPVAQLREKWHLLLSSSDLLTSSHHFPLDGLNLKSPGSHRVGEPKPLRQFRRSLSGWCQQVSGVGVRENKCMPEVQIEAICYRPAPNLGKAVC